MKGPISLGFPRWFICLFCIWNCPTNDSLIRLYSNWIIMIKKVVIYSYHNRVSNGFPKLNGRLKLWLMHYQQRISSLHWEKFGNPITDYSTYSNSGEILRLHLAHDQYPQIRFVLLVWFKGSFTNFSDRFLDFPPNPLVDSFTY